MLHAGGIGRTEMSMFGADEESSPHQMLMEATPLLEAVRELWGVDSSVAAEDHLLSLAACASLSPSERAEALLLRDAGKRVAFAVAALDAQRAHLERLLDMARARETMGR